jgi:hypothetical protein
MSSIFKTFIDNYGSSTEERAKARELIEKINADAQANWENPEWRRQMARVLTQSILEGFQFETFYDLIVQVDRVGYTDRVILTEETGLKVYFIAKGGHIEASSMVSEKMELPRDTLAFHVFEFEDKMVDNFAKNAATMRNLAVQRLDWGVNRQIKALVEAGIGVASPYYETGASVSQAALNAAISGVRDASKTGQVTIFGRASMVDQISDFTGFAPEAQEEIRLRGGIGVYRGARIISVGHDKDEDGVSFMPANEMFVIGSDAGLMAIYGGLKSKEYSDYDNWYWHYIGRQDFGGVLHRPERARRFVDTSITP